MWNVPTQTNDLIVNLCIAVCCVCVCCLINPCSYIETVELLPRSTDDRDVQIIRRQPTFVPEMVQDWDLIEESEHGMHVPPHVRLSSLADVLVSDMSAYPAIADPRDAHYMAQVPEKPFRSEHVHVAKPDIGQLLSNLSDEEIRSLRPPQSPFEAEIMQDWEVVHEEPYDKDHLPRHKALSNLVDVMVSSSPAHRPAPVGDHSTVYERPFVADHLHSAPPDLDSLLTGLDDSKVPEVTCSDDVDRGGYGLFPAGVEEVREGLEKSVLGADRYDTEEQTFVEIIEGLEVARPDTRAGYTVALEENVFSENIEIIEGLEMAFEDKHSNVESLEVDTIEEIYEGLEKAIVAKDDVVDNLIDISDGTDLGETGNVGNLIDISNTFGEAETGKLIDLSDGEGFETVEEIYEGLEKATVAREDIVDKVQQPEALQNNQVDWLAEYQHGSGHIVPDQDKANNVEMSANETVQFSAESMTFLAITGSGNSLNSESAGDGSGMELVIKPEALPHEWTLNDLLSFQQEVDKTVKIEQEERFEEIVLETRVCETKTITMELTPSGRVTVEEKTQVQTDTDLRETKRSHRTEEALLTRKVTDTKTIDGSPGYPRLVDDITISSRSSTENLQTADVLRDEPDNFASPRSPRSADENGSQTIEIEREPPLFIAVMAYEPDTENAMPLYQGERVIVLDDTHRHWWLVKKVFSGREGFVPADYLRDKYIYTALIDQMLRHNIEQLPSDTSKTTTACSDTKLCYVFILNCMVYSVCELFLY
jgi:hypothetical protein